MRQNSLRYEILSTLKKCPNRTELAFGNLPRALVFPNLRIMRTAKPERLFDKGIVSGFQFFNGCALVCNLIIPEGSSRWESRCVYQKARM